MSNQTETTHEHIPEFSLPASTGQTLSTDSFLGKMPLVLVFLEDLDSKVSRRTLSLFNDRLRDFGERRSQVLAVVKATARDVRSFVEENSLNLPILADASGSTARAYEAVDEDGNQRYLVVAADVQGAEVARFDPTTTDDVVDDALTAVESTEA